MVVNLGARLRSDANVVVAVVDRTVEVVGAVADEGAAAAPAIGGTADDQERRDVLVHGYHGNMAVACQMRNYSSVSIGQSFGDSADK